VNQVSQFASSTRIIPQAGDVPRHIAIIMDGNGRWAKKRFLPRVAGHKRGVETVRKVVRACMDRGVEYLTLFAFSSENWRRPAEEVSFLMGLFLRSLDQEVARLHENGIRLRVVGDLSRFDTPLVDLIRRSETLTENNTRLTLSICANYGGRWDIMQAVNRMMAAHPEKAGAYQEEDLAPWLALSYAPEPDLFIRTGGEQRVSNFLLWQLAYAELHFTDVLWPAFDSHAFQRALDSYKHRERRFGRTSEQLVVAGSPPAGQAGGENA
jgi:undecaprenyl diphosphate synthase